MIAHDETFLRKMLTSERMARLTQDDINELRCAADAGDPYAQYGYARWLWTMQPDKTSATTARELLLSLVDRDDAPADAEACLAATYRYGGCAAWDQVEVNTEEYVRLRDHALHRGSQLAAVMMAKNRIWGSYAACEPEAVAAELEQQLADDPTCDPIWHVILAYAYDELKREDDAINQYTAAIEAGELSAYADLGWTYMVQGHYALGDSMMEEGISHGVPGCYAWHTDGLWVDFKDLSPEEQRQHHDAMEQRCRMGTSLGESSCAYYLGQQYYTGDTGFEKDPLKALTYFERAILLGDTNAPFYLAKIMEDESWGLPSQLRYTPEQIAGLYLTTVRRYSDKALVIKHLKAACDMGFLLRHQQEIAREWQPLFASIKPEPKPKRPHEMPIDPSVILIWPSGHLDIFQADIYKMRSYGEMAESIIRAKGLDAVHWSPKLERIAKEVGLEKSLVMFCDRDAVEKNLDDNMIGTILYGQGTEIRGPIIIAMEDERHECYSFTDYEDLMDTANEIKAQTGNMLIIKDEDDGRWDAYA